MTKYMVELTDREYPEEPRISEMTLDEIIKKYSFVQEDDVEHIKNLSDNSIYQVDDVICFQLRIRKIT